MSNILVTTLGFSWQNLPLILGLTNPNVVDLYRFHPSYERIVKQRADFNIQSVDEIWVIASPGSTAGQVSLLQEWHALLAPSDELLAAIKEWAGLIDTSFWPILKIFQISGIEDPDSEASAPVMKEAILQMVLHAAEYASGGQFLLAFAGGTRSMSADLQWAAGSFGCDALIYMADDPAYRQENGAAAHSLSPEMFTASLPEDFRIPPLPQVMGKFTRNALLDMEVPEILPIRAADFPIVGTEDGRVACLQLDADNHPLTAALASRLANADYLPSFYISGQLEKERCANFESLYSLPPHVIDQLKTTRLGIYPLKELDEIRWLQKIPKAALHCQLEGVLNADDLIRVANANYLLLDRYKLRTAFQVREWRRRLDRLSLAEFREQNPLRTIADAVRDIPEPVSLCAFLMMFTGASGLLDDLIYGNLRAETNFIAIGPNGYDALGDLQGERLLQSEASIREACRILAEKAVLHNIRYLEVHCAPIRYVSGGLNPIQIVDLIEDELAAALADFSIVFTTGRYRLKAELVQLVNLAKRIMESPKKSSRLRGFDLAENETFYPSREMRKYFSPLLEKCQHITVHAGMDTDPAGIWEAVYQFNAERVSHMMILENHPGIGDEFLDRNIAVEMSPSSDFQIMGFRDNFMKDTDRKPDYPIKEYLAGGHAVTVNAENPGISRTDFTRELHRAARLSPGGLSLWDILKIVHNGFKYSFAGHAAKSRLLRKAEQEIITLIQQGIPL